MQNIKLIDITRDRPGVPATDLDVKKESTRLRRTQIMCGVLMGIVAVQSFFIWVLQVGPI